MLQRQHRICQNKYSQFLDCVGRIAQVFIWAILFYAPILFGAEKQVYATWYGEDHRGKIMANGYPFNPDKYTCASWFYPFGTKLDIICGKKRVRVEVTDHGPAWRLVRSRGVKIDLASAAFKNLAPLKKGRIPIVVMRVWSH
jgi:rare lipoprotein A (peptidoglycan hydrolase)